MVTALLPVYGNSPLVIGRISYVHVNGSLAISIVVYADITNTVASSRGVTSCQADDEVIQVFDVVLILIQVVIPDMVDVTVGTTNVHVEVAV